MPWTFNGWRTRRLGINPADFAGEGWIAGESTAALSIYSGDLLLENITVIYTFEIRETPPSRTNLAGQALFVGNVRPRRFPLLFH